MCESCKKPFYITTPIYYPSSNLHIGHAYCSTAADSMARFKKLTGYDVYFLTGTDEHGQKIERKAKEQGVTPKEYVDKIVAGIKDLWKLMDIDYSDFIRTTDDRHVKCVQKIFKQLIRATSTSLNTRAGTARPANPSGRNCSSRTAAARTAVARWKRRVKNPTSSACRSTPNG